jgi:hypothetical protein
MRGPLRESEPLRIVERPPHPRRVWNFFFAVWPSPRKRGEVRRGARLGKPLSSHTTTNRGRVG